MAAKNKTSESKITTVFDAAQRPKKNPHEFDAAYIHVHLDSNGNLIFNGLIETTADLRKLHAFLGTLLEPAEG